MDFKPIGVIHSPFTTLENMPIQPRGANDAIGNIVLELQYIEGLKDLDGFSHIYLLYHFNAAKRSEMTVTPFMDTEPRGVFSTRSPLRPNHIGLSIVQLQAIDKNRITVSGIDVLDGTPLLDIKPYIRQFDAVESSTSGWLQAGEDEVRNTRSDERFK
jgi:tRNA-Thr(GGU) m(6)t(6)A37 methyltransferase TsaA